MKMFKMNRRSSRLCGRIVKAVILLLTMLVVKRIHVKTTDYMPTRPDEQKNRNFDKYLTKYENTQWKNTSVKTILMWTPFFYGWSWLDYATVAMETCPVNCVVTKNRSKVSSADGVLFHANDLWKYRGLFGTIRNVDTEMPQYRRPDQVWALLSWEPMVYMWGKIKPHTFNWTLLYRRESTIYNPFTTWRKKTSEELESNLSHYDYDSTNYLKQKTKFAGTMVSNCFDQGQRYRITRELKKYIPVDIYGVCSGNIVTCPHLPTAQCADLHLKDYKFYLAFENSFCRDYVSEKFWNAVDRNQIPVIAAPNYNLEMMPPNSYLNVFDFPNIKTLAQRMQEIAENATLFNSFFSWRQSYKRDYESIYCKLCKELHTNRASQSYHDIEGWIQDDICYKSTPWSIVSGYIQRKLFNLGLT